MPTPRASIRLATDGKAQVERDLVDIGNVGDAQARRYATAWERASAVATAAREREAKAAERLATLTSGATNTINPITGGSYARADGMAQASARALDQQMREGEAAARRLLAAVDPLFAAQMRYNEALEQAALAQRAGALSSAQYAQVQTGLKAQLAEATALYGKQGAAMGNTRIAQMELMHVVRGSVDQFAAGAAPMQIFTMHLGMLGQAAALSGESMGKFGAFMSTGWGLALTVAVVALAPLVTKLFETGKASDDLVEKLKKQYQQTALDDQAHAAFAHTIEGSIAAMRDLTKELENQNRSLEENIALKKAAIAVALTDTLNNVGGVSGELAGAIARLHEAQHTAELASEGRLGGDNPTAALLAAQADVQAAKQRVTDLTNQLNALDTAAENGARALRSIDFPLLDRHAKELVDPIAKINRQYDDMATKAKAAATGNDALKRSLGATLDEIERERKADLDAAKKPGVNAGGTAIFNDQIANFFDIAAKYRGKSESSDKAVLESFFRAANENLDPQKTAWCAAFVNAVLAAGGVSGTGSLAASSFLGFGKDDTHSPQKGDIVIVRSGGSPSGMHVGFLDSIDSKGNVSILGGNTGNKVGESKYSASDVLGVRRPPTPAEAFADQADAAQRWATETYKILHAESEVTVAKEAQHSLMGELLGDHQSLADIIRNQIEPALKDWQHQYELIAASQQEVIDFGEQLIDDVLSPDHVKSWGDLFKLVLHDIENEFARLALMNPLKNLLDGGTRPTFLGVLQGLAGSFGGLLGGGGFNAGSLVSDNNSALSSLTGGVAAGFGYAGGTDYAPGGMAWVGEFGKELVRLPRGSKVTPAAESRRIAAANDGNIGSINFNMPVDARGADSAAVARLEQKIDEFQAAVPALVVMAFEDARSRNVIR